jgi:hypothetical protein
MLIQTAKTIIFVSGLIISWFPCSFKAESKDIYNTLIDYLPHQESICLYLNQGYSRNEILEKSSLALLEAFPKIWDLDSNIPKQKQALLLVTFAHHDAVHNLCPEYQDTVLTEEEFQAIFPDFYLEMPRHKIREYLSNP